MNVRPTTHELSGTRAFSAKTGQVQQQLSYPVHPFVTDQYSTPGVRPKILMVYCNNNMSYKGKLQICGVWNMDYQQDETGALSQLYVDRIMVQAGPELADNDKFVCAVCKKVLGTLETTQPGNRPAYVLEPGKVTIAERGRS